MKNKKYIALPIILFLVIILAFTACKKNSTEPIVVTDPNGTPLTDVNGEKITVVPETEVETVTDEKGEAVTDKDGEVVTTIKYKPQDVAIPVTNEKGEAVTNSEGEVLTTMVVVPAESTTNIIIDKPVTDEEGSAVTDASGITQTETVEIKPNPNPSSNILYAKTMGGENFDRTVASAPTPDGGYVTSIKTNSKTGTFQSENGNIKTALVKYDKQGKVVWQTILSGNNTVSVNSIVISPDGSIVVAGETRATDFANISSTEFEAFVAKFTADGKNVFITPWGGKSNESFYGVETDSNGNIYAVGFAYSQDGDCQNLNIKRGDSAAVIVKFDRDGKLLSSKAYGGFGDNFTGISINNNNEIFVCGSLTSGKLFKNRGYADSGVFTFDTNLEIKAKNIWGGSGIDYLPKIKALNGGGFIVAGSSNSYDGDLEAIGNKGSHDAFVLKYTKDCSLVWAKSISGSSEEKFTDLVITPEDNIIAVGYSMSDNRDFKFMGNLGGADAFVVKLDGSTGGIIASQGFSGSRDESFYTISILTDGKVMVGGSTLSTDGYYRTLSPKSDGKKHIATIVVFRI